MAKPLEGRAYVITGSGRGIGREVALLAASLGGSVVVNDPGFNLDGSGGDTGPAAEVVKEIEAAGGKDKPGRTPARAVKLQRDPVCGTYVTPSPALSLASGDSTVYFCSETCRDEYARSKVKG